MSVAVPPFALRAAVIERAAWSVETGLTWYRISGLSMRDLGFPAGGSLLRPFHSFVIPLCAHYALNIDSDERLVFGAGGFAALHSIYELDDELLAQAWLRSSSSFSRLQTDSDIRQSNTLGWTVSIRYEREIDDRLGSRVAVEWFEGSSSSPIEGRYFGESLNEVPVEGGFELPGARLDYRAMGLTFGLLIRIP